MKKRIILLAQYGIIESTNELGENDIQRIDDVIEFKENFKLNFIPPLLKNDQEAKIIFKTLKI